MTQPQPSRPPPRARLGLLLGLLVLAAGASWFLRSRPAPRPSPAPGQARLLADLMALEAREAGVERTVWARETAGRLPGRVFEDFWNTVNAASNRLDAAGGLAFESLLLPEFPTGEELPHGIRRFAPAASPARAGLDPAGWRTRLAGWAAAGWRLGAIEFRHQQFDCDRALRPVESRFGFRAHLEQGDGAGGSSGRAALEGELRVNWAAGTDPEAPPSIRSLDATRVTLTLRQGPPAFTALPAIAVTPPARSHFIDPLILHDLDGDGRLDILLVSANRVYALDADGRLRERPLSPAAPGLVFTAALGDFDQDGRTDLLTAKFDGLFLAAGVAGGGFAEALRWVWPAPERIRYGQTLACGDVDADGDLDVWLGQYKNPYDGGQMPTPFHDANDGHPSWLLLNDGRGNLRDGTAAAGLEAKRWRRTYAASLADLDADGDLDLAVVSDFAGLDLYANEGGGRFRDVTSPWVSDPRAFGMASALADFNADGRLDLFVTGMHCPTAARLVHLGLGRPERPDYQAMTPRMIRGNQLLIGRPGGGFDDGAVAAGVTRTGWSWGAAAADFDNDGLPDLAIANGHETRQSVTEYEPEFWLHDLYVAGSQENPVAAQYFAAKINRLRGGGHSYGGWEQNRLFLNRGPAGFLEAGHLLGVALTEDSRNLAAGDLDGDGRLELVVTTFESWPQERQTLRVFRNGLPGGNHWLAIQLPATAAGPDPAGAVVRLHRPDGRQMVGTVVTGDSHRSQQAARVHFGLGADPGVAAVEVHWPGGRTVRLDRPAADRVHVVVPAPRTP